MQWLFSLAWSESQFFKKHFFVYLLFLVLLQVSIFHLLTFSLLPHIITPSFPLCVDHNTCFVCPYLSFSFLWTHHHQLFLSSDCLDLQVKLILVVFQELICWWSVIVNRCVSCFQHRNVWIYVVIFSFFKQIFHCLYSLLSQTIRSWIFRTACYVLKSLILCKLLKTWWWVLRSIIFSHYFWYSHSWKDVLTSW